MRAVLKGDGVFRINKNEKKPLRVPFGSEGAVHRYCPSLPNGAMSGFSRSYQPSSNDLQSVHWSIVGFASCVPTVMQFREQ